MPSFCAKRFLNALTGAFANSSSSKTAIDSPVNAESTSNMGLLQDKAPEVRIAEDTEVLHCDTSVSFAKRFRTKVVAMKRGVRQCLSGLCLFPPLLQAEEVHIGAFQWMLLKQFAITRATGHHDALILFSCEAAETPGSQGGRLDGQTFDSRSTCDRHPVGRCLEGANLLCQALF